MEIFCSSPLYGSGFIAVLKEYTYLGKIFYNNTKRYL